MPEHRTVHNKGSRSLWKTDKGPRGGSADGYVWRFLELLICWSTIDSETLLVVFAFDKKDADMLFGGLCAIDDVKRTHFGYKASVSSHIANQNTIDIRLRLSNFANYRIVC